MSRFPLHSCTAHRGYCEGCRSSGEREAVERIVAFLRSQSGLDEGPQPARRMLDPLRLADMVERGDWKDEGSDG